MTQSWFEVVFYSVHIIALITSIVHLHPFITSFHNVPNLLISSTAIWTITVPRLLILNLWHRATVHQSFTLKQLIKQSNNQLINQAIKFATHCQILPYDLTVAADRHLHHHSSTAQPISHSFTKSLIQWWSCWLDESRWYQSIKQPANQSSHFPVIIAPMLYTLALTFSLSTVFADNRLINQSNNNSVNQTIVTALWLINIQSISQCVLWLTSCLILNHSVTSMFRGYQLFDIEVADQSNKQTIKQSNNHKISQSVDRSIKQTIDLSPRNSLIVDFLTLGCGLLNSHYADPQAVYHAVEWYEFNLTDLFIRLLDFCGLIAIKQSIDQSINKRIPLSFPDNAIWFGAVNHTRMWPFEYSFDYRIMYMMIELNEKSSKMFDRFWFWSVDQSNNQTINQSIRQSVGFVDRLINRLRNFSVASIRLADYLDRTQVEHLIQSKWSQSISQSLDPSIDLSNMRVFLVTNWRYFGFSFNPISYYLCYVDSMTLDPNIQSINQPPTNQNKQSINQSVSQRFAGQIDPSRGLLIGIISEVSNIPWREKCHYVHLAIKPSANQSMNQSNNQSNNQMMPYHDEVYKQMHVSPFMAMDYIYKLQYSMPGYPSTNQSFDQSTNQPNNQSNNRWLVKWTMMFTKTNKFANAIDKTKQTTYSLTQDFPHRYQSNDQSINQSNSEPNSHSIDQTNSQIINQSIKLPKDMHMKVFLNLEQQSVTHRSLFAALIKYPMFSFVVVFLIHWQAAILFFKKKAAFFYHPGLSKIE